MGPALPLPPALLNFFGVQKKKPHDLPEIKGTSRPSTNMFPGNKATHTTRAQLGTGLPISTKDKALNRSGEGTGMMEEFQSHCSN